MELASLLSLRPVPCAGLLVMVTRRCPLRCAHCSTSSAMASEEPGAGPLRDFIGSFTSHDRPEVVLLTGGEPLMHPELCADLADLARAKGSRSAILSGMFFARSARIPARIMRAVTKADHFSASLDAFHEAEVPRADVVRTVGAVLDAGVPVSFHITGTAPADPYIEDTVGYVRRAFGDRVPMLVNEVRAVGRASSWAAAGHAAGVKPARVPPTAAQPCAMAAWPVVASDGTILACCNQHTVDRRPAPEHLTLGHIAEDGWGRVRRRALASPTLRMIRTIGPRHQVPSPGLGYCASCRSLGEHPAALRESSAFWSGPGGELLEQEATGIQLRQGAVALVKRHGCEQYAHLIVLPGTEASPT